MISHGQDTNSGLAGITCGTAIVAGVLKGLGTGLYTGVTTVEDIEKVEYFLLGDSWLFTSDDSCLENVT